MSASRLSWFLATGPTMARTPRFAILFLALWLSRRVAAAEPVSIPPATPQQVHETVDRAIGYLQTESAAWLNQRKCAACHHAAMAIWSLGEADRQGYAIDKKFLADTTEATLGSEQKMIASKILSNPADPPDPRPMGKGVNIGAVFMAV